MAGRLQLIANNIKTKLTGDFFLAKQEIEQRISLLQASKGENSDACLHFLLKTACEFNLLKELHDLLELNLFRDIEQLLDFEKMESRSYTESYNGKTLLGVAAYYGHHELVSYLVEVRMANVNTKDMRGDTPLHQVVYGDSHWFKPVIYGVAPDKVAKYLIRHGGDLSIKNNKEQTPHDNTKWCAPLKIEDLVGRRFITNTGSAVYYADKVRPVFEKELAQLKRYPHPVIRSGRVQQAISFEQFCLDHAVEAYVKDKMAAFGYSSIEELYKTLDSLCEEEWQHMREVIAAQEPTPYSHKYDLIFDELPRMSKQSAMIGLLVTLLFSKNMLFSVGVGSISAVVALIYLTENAHNLKFTERSAKYERMSDLQQHDRFFKSAQRLSSQQGQHLSNSQRELDRMPTNTSENLKCKVG